MKITINYNKYIKLIFPALAIFSIALSLLTLWQVSNLETIIYETDMPTFTREEIEADILSEMKSESEVEKNKRFEENNRELKALSYVVSPNKNKGAYFQNVKLPNKKDEDVYEHTAVLVEQGEETETIYIGDYRLSYLEWLDERELVIYRSCGTECMSASIIDTKTKEQQDLLLGVGYLWSPNKEYVAAQHYSYKYGISIAKRGNEYGQTVFELRREHPEFGSGLIDQTSTAWSQDSSKVAVILRKQNEEKLELLVYNVRDSFDLLYQQDLYGTEISQLTWASQNAISWIEDDESKEIRL